MQIFRAISLMLLCIFFSGPEDDLLKHLMCTWLSCPSAVISWDIRSSMLLQNIKDNYFLFSKQKKFDILEMKAKNFVSTLIDGVDVIKNSAFTKARCWLCFLALSTSMRFPWATDRDIWEQLSHITLVFHFLDHVYSKVIIFINHWHYYPRG